jgi:hypothetical protein
MFRQGCRADTSPHNSDEEASGKSAGSLKASLQRRITQPIDGRDEHEEKLIHGKVLLTQSVNANFLALLRIVIKLLFGTSLMVQIAWAQGPPGDRIGRAEREARYEFCQLVPPVSGPFALTNASIRFFS